MKFMISSYCFNMAHNLLIHLETQLMEEIMKSRNLKIIFAVVFAVFVAGNLFAADYLIRLQGKSQSKMLAEARKMIAKVESYGGSFIYLCNHEKGLLIKKVEGFLFVDMDNTVYGKLSCEYPDIVTEVTKYRLVATMKWGQLSSGAWAETYRSEMNATSAEELFKTAERCKLFSENVDTKSVYGFTTLLERQHSVELYVSFSGVETKLFTKKFPVVY